MKVCYARNFLEYIKANSIDPDSGRVPLAINELSRICSPQVRCSWVCECLCVCESFVYILNEMLACLEFTPRSLTGN
jgi:hypothetical protein